MNTPVTYAINLKTKEHFIIGKEGYVPVDWRYVHTKDGWIPNTNGPMEDEVPVNGICDIEILTRNGELFIEDDPWSLYWGDDGDPCDIAYYRPIDCKTLEGLV